MLQSEGNASQESAEQSLERGMEYLKIRRVKDAGRKVK